MTVERQKIQFQRIRRAEFAGQAAEQRHVNLIARRGRGGLGRGRRARLVLGSGGIVELKLAAVEKPEKRGEERNVQIDQMWSQGNDVGRGGGGEQVAKVRTSVRGEKEPRGVRERNVYLVRKTCSFFRSSVFF